MERVQPQERGLPHRICRFTMECFLGRHHIHGCDLLIDGLTSLDRAGRGSGESPPDPAAALRDGESALQYFEAARDVIGAHKIDRTAFNGHVTFKGDALIHDWRKAGINLLRVHKDLMKLCTNYQTPRGALERLRMGDGCAAPESRARADLNHAIKVIMIEGFCVLDLLDPRHTRREEVAGLEAWWMK